MKYVKHADTWHLVDDDAKPTPAMIATSVGTRRDGRPALTAKCGQQVHTGTFDAPIDDGERCAACAETENPQ